jgi:hypothetical protein
MMRGYHEIDRRTERPIRQRPLAVCSDVARQHRAPTGALDRHYARAVIVRCDCVRGVHDAESHAVPLPALTGATRAQRIQSRHRFTAHKRAHVHRSCDGGIATDVIEVGVTQHDGVEDVTGIASKIRHHNDRTEIEAGRKAWTGVVQQAVPRRLDNHAESLSDVEHGQRELTVHQSRVYRHQRQ